MTLKLPIRQYPVEHGWYPRSVRVTFQESRDVSGCRQLASVAGLMQLPTVLLSTRLRNRSRHCLDSVIITVVDVDLGLPLRLLLLFDFVDHVSLVVNHPPCFLGCLLQ